MLIATYLLIVGWLAHWIDSWHDLLIWAVFILVPFLALEVYAKEFWRGGR